MAVVQAKRSWSAGLFALVLLAGGSSLTARADANGGIAAAIGLTAADGSVRTQTGVRLSISPAPGAPDRVMSFSAPVQARMGAVRECFAAAMLRSSSTEGVAEFELESTRSGARVRTTVDETGDAQLISCMKGSLAGTKLSGLPRGSRARVGLYLSNPVAALKKRMAEAKPTAQVKIAGGRAASEGGTSAGEVKFRVSAASSAARTVAGLQTDISENLAGLLDCRRKASRGHDATGSLEMNLQLRHGNLGHSGTRSTLKHKADQCVEQWLGKLDASKLADADVALAISFNTP